MKRFTVTAGPAVHRHFKARRNYLNLLSRNSTTAEEWFRIELISLFENLSRTTVQGTNHRYGRGMSRPDFTIQHQGRQLLIELKVLPRDRNYPYAWQRFRAGKNNRKDFRSLEAGRRNGIILIYWPDSADWANCRDRLKAEFAVECIRVDEIPCEVGRVFFSYWASRRDT